VVDVDWSRDYRAGHIPGAWYGIRARLDEVRRKLPPSDAVTFTSADGVLARLAAADWAGVSSIPAFALDGGTAAWRAEGFPLEQGATGMACEPDDIRLRAREQGANIEEAMRAYLDWEINLAAQMAADDDQRFRAEVEQRTKQASALVVFLGVQEVMPLGQLRESRASSFKIEMYSQMSVTIRPKAPYHSMYFGAPRDAPCSIKSKSRIKFSAAYSASATAPLVGTPSFNCSKITAANVFGPNLPSTTSAGPKLIYPIFSAAFSAVCTHFVASGTPRCIAARTAWISLAAAGNIAAPTAIKSAAAGDAMITFAMALNPADDFQSAATCETIGRNVANNETIDPMIAQFIVLILSVWR
jgi:rhodanese-related sulfurtransferase